MKTKNEQKKNTPFKLKTNVKAGARGKQNDGVDPDSPQRISFDNE